jgi:anti-sigma B factor antagonist
MSMTSNDPSTSERLLCGSVARVIVARPTEEAVVVAITGDIDDATAPRLRELLHRRLNSCRRTVVVDLSAVAFVDCAGMALLCECQHHATVRSVSLRLVTGGNGRVDRLVHLLGIGHRLSRHASVPEALAR